MKALTIDWVKQNGLLLFEAITGSKAYGLDTAQSDTDIRGVFVLPKDMYYSLEYTAQVSNETNDVVYYELKRFMELLSKNNPTMLEMLNIPEQFILYKDPLMNNLDTHMFLSKLCEKTFANYAYTQIKKAYGLEKKIVNPVEEERKSVLDFCYVYANKDAISLSRFLIRRGWEQHQLGLSVIPHLKDCYNLFHSNEIKYSGVLRKENANEVALSNIPKGESPIAMLYFNKDGYSVYCKKYKEYWEWVDKRNEARYSTTMSHGKNYDSKNMMHVFRLLLMAKEIATEGKINVYRKDREFLLSIKEGKYEYDNLLAKAETLKNELPLLYERSSLPGVPDVKSINKLLIKTRKEYYKEN
ncbi:MAG TPA: nucleotidyltransferase domain-containing protein [Parafilimonas sp.]|nr:nucleotidyltransferase domain-containing protein [Parafilimonas sp.]